MALAASADTLMPSRRGNPATSPTSRPTLAGSTSMAPTTLNPGLSDTCLRMAAPIGPRPKCITRMCGMLGIITRLIDLLFLQLRERRFQPRGDGGGVALAPEVHEVQLRRAVQ